MHSFPLPAPVARLAVVALVGVLVASCAIPTGPAIRGSRVESGTDRGVPAPAAEPKYSMIVTELRGRAWVQRDGKPIGLKEGSTVGENQPIQVGARSILRMQLGDQALFELAPNTRLVVHQLPRDGYGDARATWLRIEQGYLRLQWKGTPLDPPMQVSFGIWAARLKPGEYFFDTRGRVAAACAASGSMRLSGVPEWTPQGSLQECLKLEANKSPLAIAMTDAQWSAVRAQRRLHPTLALAARNQSKAAIARLEREQVRSPGRKPSAPEPEPAPVAKAPVVVAPPPVAVVPRTPVPPPVAAIPPPPPPRAEDDASRERTADELIHEAEEVRNSARAAPAPRLPPANPKMPVPVLAPSVAMTPNPPAAPATPLPGLARRSEPPTPPPPPAPEPPPVVVVPPPSAPPPEPEPAYEEPQAPPAMAQRSPPVIVIPAEPEPEPESPPVVVVVPPPSAPPPEPEYEAPPPMAQRSPPVIVIPAEPEPEPEPVAPPPPPPPPPAPPAPAPPPAVALAPPAPPPVVTPTPRSPPVITIPAEPEPQPVTPAPSAPPPRAAPPPSSIELAEQSPVVIPPSTQPPVSDSGPRPVGSATPPSVPLDVAMYSVAAMPDKIGDSGGALIVPPTITHEPANSQWLVNVASYPTIDAAKDHARMLVKQKLRAGVREQALPDRMSYLVVIEGYPTEEAAETAAIDLESHFDLDPY